MTTDTLSYTRDLSLPPARMWPLLTNAEMRAVWGAPNGDATLDTLSHDFRIGGIDHHRCGPADVPEFEQITRWYHIQDPSDLVYTEVIQAGGMDLGASLVTMQLTPNGTGSALTVTVALSSFVGPEMIAEFKDGWSGSMANLDRLIAQQDSV